MKDLCQKWKVKLIVRGACNRLMADLADHDPHILRQIASVTNLNEPSRALATSTITWVRSYSSIPFGPL